MSADVAYLDSSAFVKLVTPEAESGALEAYLPGWSRHTSSELLLVEVLRGASRWGSDAVERARLRMRSVALVALERPLLELAASLGPMTLRSLDAIHLATAQQLGPDLGVIVTYDRRLAAAASELGLPVASPL